MTKLLFTKPNNFHNVRKSMKFSIFIENDTDNKNM